MSNHWPRAWDVPCAHHDAVLVIEQSRRIDVPACAQPLRTGQGYVLSRLLR